MCHSLLSGNQGNVKWIPEVRGMTKPKMDTMYVQTLFIKSETDFNISDHIDVFSEICKNSKEFQGHDGDVVIWQQW